MDDETNYQQKVKVGPFHFHWRASRRVELARLEASHLNPTALRQTIC